MKERRGFYEMIFGKPKRESSNRTLLKMLNGHSPTFSAFSGEAYDSDVVRSAVDAIARNAAKLKPKHIRRMGGEIRYAGSNVERLLAVRPNPYMDAYSFYYKVITQLYLRNNSFIYVDWDEVTGQPKAFHPVLSSSVELLEGRDSPGGEIYARFRFMTGQVKTAPYSELIHLRRFFYKNDLFGETSGKALNPTLELIKTTDEGIVNAVKSSAFLRGLLKFTSMLKPEDMKKQRDAFVADYMDINNNGGVAATDAKAEYQELKTEPKLINAAQMKAIQEKVYSYFGINEKIVKSNYTEDEWNAFYESTLEPLAVQMSLEFTSKLFTGRERGYGNEIVFEANRLQYASNKTKINVVTTLVDRGMMSLNQGLEVFNMPPIEGGDKRIVSLNFVDADKANLYQIGVDDDKPDEGGDGDGGSGNEPGTETEGP